METPDTSLQASIERWAEDTYLQWKFDDAAERPWDVEYIYIFLGAFIVYLAASAIINKYKNNNKND